MAEDSIADWKPWPVPGDTSNKPRAWHKSRVPYHNNSHDLQNVDIWVSNIKWSFLHTPGPWLIYIHGGGWRDPIVDSASFHETVNHILSDKSDIINQIGGLASINYSLSPHPHHASLPAPIPASGVKAIPSRSAKHPDHIVDVLNAIGFLNAQFGFDNNYILAGHSCGATLALQVAMDRSQWSHGSSHASEIHNVPRPIAIIGLNGLYDLPALISDPGEKHQHLQELYEAFTRLAFGESKKDWAAVSPTSVSDWSKSWPEGRLVVLVQSHEDTLVPYSQTDLMFKNLRQNHDTKLKIEEMDATGDHNGLWEKGDRLAEIIKTVLMSFS